MIEDGEIPFLDADPLHEGMEFYEQERPLGVDEAAIEHIAERLRKQGGRSAETIEEVSVDLYNKICENIRSGRASRDQIQSAAELFRENPQELLDRLRS